MLVAGTLPITPHPTYLSFKCKDLVSHLQQLAWMQRTQEGRSVTINSLSIFTVWSSWVFARFLEGAMKVLSALSERQREITVQQQNLHTHPFVVIFNLCCHANLHHQRGILLTVLSKDEIPILASEVLWCAHEEHLPPAGGLALLLPHLPRDKGQCQGNSSSNSPGTL